MRKLIVLVAALVLLANAPGANAAADAYDDSQSHPLRLLAYVIHPVGYTLEWLVTRPFHQFVGQRDLEPVFGHDEHGYYGDSAFGTGGSAARRTD